MTYWIVHIPNCLNFILPRITLQLIKKNQYKLATTIATHILNKFVLINVMTASPISSSLICIFKLIWITDEWNANCDCLILQSEWVPTELYAQDKLQSTQTINNLQISWLHCASTILNPFNYHLMQITLKNAELLKHSKLDKNAPTCFGLHRSHLQGAKVSAWLKKRFLTLCASVGNKKGSVF